MDENKRLYYLDQMGIQAWVSNQHVAQAEGVEVQTPANVSDNVSGHAPERSADHVISNLTAQQEQTASSLEELKLTVSDCTQCELHRTRTQTVFGIGHPAAEWLIIGEAPGVEEDRLGEPFLGREGQLLTSMLRAMGLAREEVFITNILKCKLPNSRDPKEIEVSSCSSHLRQQIELIQPKVILVVGGAAAQSLLNIDTPISKMRGKKYSYQNTDIPVVVTFHPAYLLQSPQQKREAWEDLKFALQVRSH